ncbi:DUF11 domain-containing protein [Fibrella sp. HMF5335]|uniref:DUF11 domain-containing protein n=1 Tax=Fibrella rubiginis TaxID=2817060 RepID=A0A939K351_9BACT|nr:SdrD B-like domain-containing protein [Fibrella rubiginis]MBO0935273.1 DUF11 domain-containing protein [Fibrella rubiginis]
MKKFYRSAVNPQSRFVGGWFVLLLLWLLVSVAQAQTLTGTVFRDFNANGLYEATPASGTYTYGEPGLGGVEVRAYNAAGTNVTNGGVQLTTAAGAYTITPTGSGPFRVEFTIPTALNVYYEGAAGSGSRTSVQFVSSAPATVNFGVNYPHDYCQKNPEVVTACFVAINPTNKPAIGDRDVLVGVPYAVVDNAKTISHYATVNQIGAAWGLAYRKDKKQLFAAAFTKRHVGFAYGGPNAIYVTDFSSATATTSEFFSFTTVGGGAVSTTTETHGNDLPTSLNANGKLDSYDLPAFDAVGKTSLGAMDMSDDDKTLYVVNLKDRKLYLIDVATKTPVGFAIPNPCGGQSYRPFAVKYHQGKAYVGVVCTREDLNLDANNDRKPDSYTSTAGLSATVFEFDGSTFTTALSFPLTYKKQPTNADLPGQPRAEYWRPWSASYQTDRTDTSYPQAWLTDIEFDVNGDMILGLRDRFGDQMGFQNHRPIANDAALVSAISPGEVLRAGKCSSTATTWTLESNGALCGATPSTQQDTEQGPGGGKYYWGDRVQDGANHGISSMAGLALLPGSGKLAMTAIDSQDDFNTGGIKRLINATGAKDGNPTGTAHNPGSGAVLYGNDAFGYGKASGLGDLEVLCNPAPIMIGNRVWNDANNNGTQDPGEASLAGVTVTLKGPGLPTAGASVTTNSAGEYYFSNAAGTATTGFVYSLTGLTYGSSYSLSFPASASALVLSTRPNSATGTNADAIDSDPSATGLVSFTLGQAGQNNFTYDAAYLAVPPCSLSVAVGTPVCSSATNQYTATGRVWLSNTPAGSLSIVDNGVAMTPVSVSAGQTSVEVSLTGLSNASSHTLTVTSSNSTCGTASTTYAAPVSCSVAPLATYDIDKTVDLKQVEKGQIVTYTLSVTNTSGVTATNLELTDQLSTTAVTFVGSVTASAGTFTPAADGGSWRIGSLAGGQVATLRYRVRLNDEGITYNTVTAPNGQTATVCTTVPFRVCAGESFEFLLSVPASYSTYQWSFNGQPIVGATTSTLSVTAVGKYTVMANGMGGCPTGDCCPFVIDSFGELPSLTAVAQMASCLGATAQNDARITLVGSSASLSYNITKASSFTAATPLLASARNLSAVVGGVLLGGEANPAAPQDYTIRVYSATGCFSDTVVRLLPTTCVCPPTTCAPFVVKKIKSQGKAVAP